MTHFFSVYKELEGKKTAIDYVQNADAAKQVIQDCLDRYVEKFCR